MDAKDLISSTGCASFVTDSDGTIIMMNEAAERILGQSLEEVMGKVCHDVIRGKDIFGNRFCDGVCSIHKMVRRREPVQHFQMVMEHSSGNPVPVGMCTMVIRSEDSPGYQILHMLQPVEKLVSGRAAVAAEFAEHSASAGMIDRGQDGREGNLLQLAAQLTTREKEVLNLLKDGVPTKSIADRLEISVTTVRNHIQGILRKLGAHSRLEAVSIARKSGVI